MFEHNSILPFLFDFYNIKPFHIDDLTRYFGFHVIEDKYCCSNKLEINFIIAVLVDLSGVVFEIRSNFEILGVVIICLPDVGMKSS
jgi:hypothetical protein